MLGEMRRAQQSHFFAGPEREDQSSLRTRILSGVLREVLREFQDSGHAGSIVIGAIVNLAFFIAVFTRAAFLAEAEMIVVRTDHDIFLLLAGKDRDDIVVRT